MSTVGQAAAPARPPARRPTAWRRFGASYLDMLFSAFLAWVSCHAFQAHDEWFFVFITIYFIQAVFCRGNLKPTLWEATLGVRYLMSTSNQVVADIKVVNPKLKLNAFLMAAGVVEISLALAVLSLWTVLDQAASWGTVLKEPTSFLYYGGFGILLFLCAASLLSGSRNARWAVPIVHAGLLLDHFVSAAKWLEILPGKEVLWPWAAKAAKIEPGLVASALLFFAAWSLVLAVGTGLSRKYLVQ